MYTIYFGSRLNNGIRKIKTYRTRTCQYEYEVFNLEGEHIFICLYFIFIKNSNIFPTWSLKQGIISEYITLIK